MLEESSSLHAVMFLSTVCPTSLLLGQTRGLDLVQLSIANPGPGSLGSILRIGLSVRKMKITIVYTYNMHNNGGFFLSYSCPLNSCVYSVHASKNDLGSLDYTS